MISHEHAGQLLRKNAQEHVLRFWDRLDAGQKKCLLAQVESLDFRQLELMRDLLKRGQASDRSSVEPAEVIDPSTAQRAGAEAEGARLIRDGRVGVLLVAGGQGSRLGFDGPKGCLPLAPLSKATLFEIHSRKILALKRKYSAEIPFYVMTSQGNNRPTVDFFERNGYFGLSGESVRFFNQGLWPALWEDGRIVMESPGSMFMSPDGHGGILSALDRNGMLDDMKKRGLSHLFYFQVDNPLVEIADPAFLGLHQQHGADISVKVCAKRDPNEGLGVVVERGGRRAIVEYTELSEAQKNERLPDGRLKFEFGSVAIHIFSLPFLCKEAGRDLPLHVAHKKVPYCSETGDVVKPDKPNAFKFERFIFDTLPNAAKVLAVAFAREEEFSPVKNASGADTADTARRDMTLKFARWLKACGVDVPLKPSGDPEYMIEIDPCFALGPADLRKALGDSFTVKGDVLLKQS